jgi:hypothetical protein
MLRNANTAPLSITHAVLYSTMQRCYSVCEAHQTKLFYECCDRCACADSAPAVIKLYINRDSMGFSDCEVSLLISIAITCNVSNHYELFMKLPAAAHAAVLSIVSILAHGCNVYRARL